MPAVQELLGLELYTLRMLARQPLPFVLAAVTSELARAVVDAVALHGGAALAPTWGAMEHVGLPEDVVGYALDAHELQLELQKGGTARVARGQALLCIHGVVKTRTAKETKRDLLALAHRPMRNRFGRMPELEDATATTVELAREEMLMLVLREGRVLQVGRRCRFPLDWGPAADWRGHLKRVAVLFSSWDDSILMDTAFARFVPPRDIRLRMEQVQMLGANSTVVVQSDSTAFDFYLRWRFCVASTPHA